MVRVVGSILVIRYNIFFKIISVEDDSKELENRLWIWKEGGCREIVWGESWRS